MWSLTGETPTIRQLWLLGDYQEYYRLFTLHYNALWGNCYCDQCDTAKETLAGALQEAPIWFCNHKVLKILWWDEYKGHDTVSAAAERNEMKVEFEVNWQNISRESRARPSADGKKKQVEGWRSSHTHMIIMVFFCCCLCLTVTIHRVKNPSSINICPLRYFETQELCQRPEMYCRTFCVRNEEPSLWATQVEVLI